MRRFTLLLAQLASKKYQELPSTGDSQVPCFTEIDNLDI
jgi:hypothetical protein